MVILGHNHFTFFNSTQQAEPKAKAKQTGKGPQVYAQTHGHCIPWSCPVTISDVMNEEVGYNPLISTSSSNQLVMPTHLSWKICHLNFAHVHLYLDISSSEKSWDAIQSFVNKSGSTDTYVWSDTHPQLDACLTLHRCMWSCVLNWYPKKGGGVTYIFGSRYSIAWF